VEDSGNSNTNTPVNSVATKTASSSRRLAPALPGTSHSADLSAPKYPGKKGLVVFDFPTHHFGEAKQNTQLQHDFVLTNNVKVPIRIVGMKPSCSCIWAESNDSFVGSVPSFFANRLLTNRK
jgi:hypothetical protein